MLAGLLVPLLESATGLFCRLFPARGELLRVRKFWRQPLTFAGLDQAGKFIALEGVRVTGHGWKCQRHVSRVEDIAVNGSRQTLYLKKEAGRGWLASLWQGESGLLREAKTLMDLEREGIPGPRWVAYGRNRQGSHFLLVESFTDTVPLGTYLAEQNSRVQKKAVLRLLAWTLARVHFLGFSHQDLYPKHVLVDPETRKVYLLDWQRATRRRGISWRHRADNLARLHATLGEEHLSLRERAALLGEYFTALQFFGAQAGDFPALSVFAAAIERQASRLLKRRHIQEKRLGRSPTQPQDWIHLEGDDFRITSTCTPALLQIINRWLENPPLGGQSRSSDSIQLAGQAGTLRIQWTKIPWWKKVWARMTGKGGDPSAEHSQATALYCLQRQALETGKILALGMRQSAGQSYSFLATSLPAGSVPLEEWLACAVTQEPRGKALKRRAQVISQVGKVLARIHQAGYILESGATPRLCVIEGNGDCVVLESAAGLRRADARKARQENYDRGIIKLHLTGLGSAPGEVNLYRQAYWQELSLSQALTARAGLQLAARGGESEIATVNEAPFKATDSLVESSPTTGASPLQKRVAPQGGFTREFATPNWIDHLGPDWSERILDMGVTDRFHAKQGRSVGRLILPAGMGKPRLGVYLKRHYQAGWWNVVLGWLFRKRFNTPGLQEWENLNTARSLGLNVPEVEAVAEFSGPGLHLQSALAVRELDGMLALHEAIPLAATRLAPREFRLWKKSLVGEMARMARILHDCHWFHKDLYLCHFYIHEEHTFFRPNWRNQVCLIDLHRLQHHSFTWRIWWIKDLAQLLYSSELQEIDNRDRVAFWQAYRQTGPRPLLEKWMLRIIRIKWARYRNHNCKRRAA